MMENKVIRKSAFPFEFTWLHIQATDDMHETKQLHLGLYPLKMVLERSYMGFVSFEVNIFKVGFNLRLQWY